MRLAPCQPGRWTLQLVAGLVAAMAVAACAPPGDGISRQAGEAGFSSAIETGQGFRHVVFRSPVPPEEGRVLHVYLAGDGRAWVTPRRVAVDPTPDESTVLALMAGDPGPAVMVGRPCYHGLAADAVCHPGLWTHRRYAPEVVASMAAVIEKERRRGDGPSPLLLVGYSGGGALAVLLAAELRQVRGVITVAGNLDTAAWTAHHGYSPLTGSLDPARRPALPATLPRLHLVGEGDEEVLPAWTRAYAARRPGARVVGFPGFDHRCCWAAEWPDILAGLRGRVSPVTGATFEDNPSR